MRKNNSWSRLFNHADFNALPRGTLHHRISKLCRKNVAIKVHLKRKQFFFSKVLGHSRSFTFFLPLQACRFFRVMHISSFISSNSSDHVFLLLVYINSRKNCGRFVFLSEATLNVAQVSKKISCFISLFQALKRIRTKKADRTYLGKLCTLPPYTTWKQAESGHGDIHQYFI